MAMRTVVSRGPLTRRLMESTRRTATSTRYFSDGTGRVLGEEERAAENVYIKKMERERMEKLKLKAEKEKAAAEKEKGEKKAEESYKG
ncbi:hypothetical protein L1049_011128 [Liquidambar formosana]|uniref:Mitochondrial ATPase inhibitor n=1 Tax=Liquidambar formosana TaxID=63359 RepID=A0AAP0RR08_LIQFO